MSEDVSDGIDIVAANGIAQFVSTHLMEDTPAPVTEVWSEAAAIEHIMIELAVLQLHYNSFELLQRCVYYLPRY